jgi:hypothetical protein
MIKIPAPSWVDSVEVIPDPARDVYVVVARVKGKNYTVAVISSRDSMSFADADTYAPSINWGTIAQDVLLRMDKPEGRSPIRTRNVYVHESLVVHYPAEEEDALVGICQELELEYVDMILEHGCYRQMLIVANGCRINAESWQVHHARLGELIQWCRTNNYLFQQVTFEQE